MADSEKQPRGRPRVEYSEKYHPRWAASLARRGLTHEEIAREMGISNGLFYKWRKWYPDFVESLKETKGSADAEVEISLFKRAIGYPTEEIRIVENGEGEVVRKERFRRKVPPDVTAQIFWLKNRQPELWRDVNRASDRSADPMLQVLKALWQQPEMGGESNDGSNEGESPSGETDSEKGA